MKIRIAMMGYRTLAEMFRGLIVPPDLVGKVELSVHDALFDNALQVAIELEREGAVDVFVSGSGNASFIEPHLRLPVVKIAVSAFDLIKSIKEASAYGDKIAVVNFREPVEGLAEVLDMLRPSVVQVTYETYDDLQQKIAQAKESGCCAVVGASLACEIAAQNKLPGVMIYSNESLRMALRKAYEIGLSTRRERERAESLQTILDFAYGGIIVADSQGVITLFNPAAERILGIPAKKVLGRRASEAIENSKLEEVLNTATPQLNQVQDIGDVRIITNRVPIIDGSEVVGVVATFQDVNYIQNATEELRRAQYRKGFTARATFEDICHGPSSLADVIEKAKLFARSDLSVLITGESGVGKELFAQSIHNASNRSRGPFVAINCAALSESLLESELFGYEEGSFTGARRGGKEGLFELAHRGTIFLDEIGEISPGIQARLLRVIQEKEIIRVGGTRVIPVDVRIIASTNRDLWEMVQTKKFRDDLYYRLNVLSLEIPPLRERPEDIPVLIKHILSRRREANKKLLTPARLAALGEAFTQHEWPGNVRELENALDRLVVLVAGRAPEPAELAQIARSVLELPRPPKSTIFPDIEPHGKDDTSQHGDGHLAGHLVERALAESGGNMTRAAKMLGVSRTTLWRMLKKMEGRDALPSN